MSRADALAFLAKAEQYLAAQDSFAARRFTPLVTPSMPGSVRKTRS